LEVVDYSSDESNPNVQSPVYPAIVVVDNNQVVTKISGKSHKDVIVKSVSDAVENW
jgi:hypothetical protein